MFTQPAVDLVALAAPARPARPLRQGPQPRARPARVRRRVAGRRRWPRRSRRRGPGQIRALVTSAGNPVLSTPNGGAPRARAGRPRLHGARRLLPQRDDAPRAPDPAADVRRSSTTTTTSCSTCSRCATPPSIRRRCSRRPPDARHDWQILLELAARAASARTGAAGRARASRAPCCARLGPRGLRGGAAAHGAARRGLRPFGRGLTLRQLKKAPHGIDLGPLEPCLPERLYTRGPAHRPGPAALPGRPRAAAAAPAIAADAGARAHRPARPALEQLLDAQQPRAW